MPTSENSEENGFRPGFIQSSSSSNYNSISTSSQADRIPPSSSSRPGQDHSQDGDSGYTELLRGGVPCPTCRGLGNVPKEQEGQLIALIPLKDKRLKPRRTCWWVSLAVFVCLTAASLLLFFLFPRSVDLESRRPYLKPVGPVRINVTKEYVNFVVINRFNVSNHNYFPVRVTSVVMTVLYDTQVIQETTNKTSLEIPIRANREYHVQANITLDSNNQMGYMASSCSNEIRWAHEMVMLFEFTCNYNFLGHSEETTLQTFQFVSCYSKNMTSGSVDMSQIFSMDERRERLINSSWSED